MFAYIFAIIYQFLFSGIFRPELNRHICKMSSAASFFIIGEWIFVNGIIYTKAQVWTGNISFSTYNTYRFPGFNMITRFYENAFISEDLVPGEATVIMEDFDIIISAGQFIA